MPLERRPDFLKILPDDRAVDSGFDDSPDPPGLLSGGWRSGSRSISPGQRSRAAVQNCPSTLPEQEIRFARSIFFCSIWFAAAERPKIPIPLIRPEATDIPWPRRTGMPARLPGKARRSPLLLYEPDNEFEIAHRIVSGLRASVNLSNIGRKPSHAVWIRITNIYDISQRPQSGDHFANIGA